MACIPRKTLVLFNKTKVFLGIHNIAYMPSPGVFFRHSHAFQSILMTNGDSKNSKVFKKIKKKQKIKIAWSRNLNSICIPVSPRPDYPVLQGRAWRSLASDAPLDVAMRVVYDGCDSGFSRRGHESFRARATSVICSLHGHVGRSNWS